MTATTVRPSGLIPSPRPPGDDAAARTGAPAGAGCAAVGYQRVLHQLVRRELRLLAELAGWAGCDDAGRTASLARHAGLIGRLLLHHHRLERDAVWPALLATAPAGTGPAVDACTARCADVDRMIRDVATAARQWEAAGTASARTAFAAACRALADEVDAQTAEEERILLPLLATHLAPADWRAVTAGSRPRLSGAEQLLVLGLALEDASAGDRARLVSGLPRSVRLAWRVHGRRRYRAAVVRLRGAPPAA